MIRKLKALTLASLAAAALSAVEVQAAGAVEPHFASSESNVTLTTIKDEHNAAPKLGPTTAHLLFDISRIDGSGLQPFTCNEIVADGATVENPELTWTEITTTLTFKGECRLGPLFVNVSMGACEFVLTADGIIHVQTDTGPGIVGNCEVGSNPITWLIAEPTTSCKVEIGEQTIGGVKYHNIETNGFKMITLEAANLTNIKYKATGTLCPYGETENGRITTGNTIFTAEKDDGSGEMVDIEWTTEDPEEK